MCVCIYIYISTCVYIYTACSLFPRRSSLPFGSVLETRNSTGPTGVRRLRREGKLSRHHFLEVSGSRVPFFFLSFPSFSLLFLFFFFRPRSIFTYRHATRSATSSLPRVSTFYVPVVGYRKTRVNQPGPPYVLIYLPTTRLTFYAD